MDKFHVSLERLEDILKASIKGGWSQRGVTVLDTDLNRSKCVFPPETFVVVEDAYDVTVLRIDEHGFVTEVVTE